MTHRRSSSSSPRPPSRGDVVLLDLDPTRGSEIRKTRPCLIVSPDELNHRLRTLVVAPMTTAGKPYPWRIDCHFDGRDGRVALDQLRTIDRNRVVQRLGAIDVPTMERVLAALAAMFAP